LLDFSKKKCYFTNQYLSSRKYNNKKKQDDDQSANATIDEIENALICSLDSFINSWIMDSSVSFHTTSSLELLSNYVS